MGQQRKKLTFEFLSESDEITETRQIEGKVVKIGRIRSAQLQLDDPDISRIHAVLECSEDGSVRIIDLGSQSGTFVNGEEITKAEVEDGDELRVGQTRMRVSIAEPVTEKPDRESAEGLIRIVVDEQISAEDYPVPDKDEYEPVELPDGRVVYPYEEAGYYDDDGSYRPGFYDEHGDFYFGYGYYDDEDEWQVRFGHYDNKGQWVSSDETVRRVEKFEQKSSDKTFFRKQYFNERPGDTLEIALFWGDRLLEVKEFRYADVVVAGEDEHHGFGLPEQKVGDGLPLIARRDGVYHLIFDAQTEGALRKDGKTRELSELVGDQMAVESDEFEGYWEVPFAPEDGAEIQVNGLSFLIHFTDMPEVPTSVIDIDKESIGWFALSAAVQLILLFIILTTPDAAGSLEMDKFDMDDQFVKLMVKPQQQQKEKVKWHDSGEKNEGSSKHKGAKGKSGKKEVDNKTDGNKTAVKGPSENKDPEVKKNKDREVVEKAGAVAALNKDEVSSMFGQGEESVGSEARDALGKMQGEAAGSSQGMRGLGVSGTGRGGGGQSEKGFGVGDVDTAGRAGTGRLGTGEQKGQLGEKTSQAPEFVAGKPDVRGSLPREVIRRIVRQHRRELKYCYEQQLQRYPKLAGEVKMKFTIDTTGQVIAAVVEESTLDNGPVEDCVSRKIRQWQFPEPKGGGVVVVHYPFHFSS